MQGIRASVILQGTIAGAISQVSQFCRPFRARSASRWARLRLDVHCWATSGFGGPDGQSVWAGPRASGRGGAERRNRGHGRRGRWQRRRRDCLSSRLSRASPPWTPNRGDRVQARPGDFGDSAIRRTSAGGRARVVDTTDAGRRPHHATAREQRASHDDDSSQRRQHTAAPRRT